MQSFILPIRSRSASSTPRLLRRCPLRERARSCRADHQPVPQRSFHYSCRLRDQDVSNASREPIIAAPEIDFDGQDGEATIPVRPPPEVFRIVPASAAYFTTKPKFFDTLLNMEALLRKYQTLPVVEPSQAPRVSWSGVDGYERMTGEKVRPSRYKRLILVMQRLNRIHPDVIPEEVKQIIRTFALVFDEEIVKTKTLTLDEYGRAIAIGKRKSSAAVVYLVEGDGQVLVNGKTLSQVFSRVHDRQSAVWPLTATNRLNKYNVWATAKGGGVTGQAEAITLGIAKALMVHEPLLKATLRKAGVVTRDARKVERKKPGKVKARKMPAWVKR